MPQRNIASAKAFSNCQAAAQTTGSIRKSSIVLDG